MDSGLPTQLELSETEQRILVGALAGSSRAEISKNLSLGRGDWEAAWQHICFLLGVPDRKCALRLVAAYAVQSLGASSTSQTRLNAETQKRSLAEKRLNQMSVHTKTGGWQLDVATGEVSWTEGCYLVIGRDAKLPPLSAQEYAALVHPEDQARHRVALDRLFASCEPLDITYRLLLPTGEIYVHSAAHAERDENGEIVRFIGTVQDITELQLSREKDEESKRLFESIASSVPDLLYVLDVRTQKVTYANRSMGAMLGYDVDETAVMGASFFERLTHSEDKNIWSGHRETVMALSDGEFHRVEYRMWHNDGSWV
ncbi:MAG TPA: PAS domain-containing protein, partial [Fimbriimonas sp.]|nr:PAS domain-containing protein [Fimbriimonas sp.]